MARRRSGDAEKKKEEEEEEIDTHQTLYIDTSLDTHLALVASEFDSVLDIKSIVPPNILLIPVFFKFTCLFHNVLLVSCLILVKRVIH